MGKTNPFGEPEKGRISNDNPLGLPEEKEGPTTVETEEVPREQQAAGQPSPEETPEAEATQAPETPSEVETEEEKVTVDSDRDEKIKYIREKFDGPESLRQSIGELENKLGLDSGTFQTEGEAVDYYIRLEEELGRRGAANAQEQQISPNYSPDTVQRLMQQNRFLRTQMSQMREAGQQQRPEAPVEGQPQRQELPRNQRGQFTTTQQQNAAPDINLDDIDLGDTISKKEFRRSLLSGNVNSNAFKQAVANIADQVSQQRLNQLQNQVNDAQGKPQQQESHQQQQQQQRSRELYANYRNQADRLKEKVGEEQFQGAEEDMRQFFNEYPIYLNPSLFPNGFERAYQAVMRRKGAPNQFKQENNEDRDRLLAQKKAGQMPGSEGGGAQMMNNQQRQLTPQEKFDQQLKYAEGKQGGIFG